MMSESDDRLLAELKAHQCSGNRHPFTCPARDESHRRSRGDFGVLKPEYLPDADGHGETLTLYCPDCGYRQGVPEWFREMSKKRR